MSTLQKTAIVAVVQFLILFSVIAFKQYTLLTGETVLLKTAPIDPTDPFRGDYVTVRYEISRIDLDDVAGDPYSGDPTWVELREGTDGIWDAVAVHYERERTFPDTVLIKGRLEYNNCCFDDGSIDNEPTIEVRYGIEQIFIPEGSGADIPTGTDHEVAVEVKVDRFGNAVARHLVVNGEELELERR